ncbi:MAG TPA: ATP-binding protein [Pirellulales bacterium]|nr:ATP-binding protein [Pirellulales bacterium]
MIDFCRELEERVLILSSDNETSRRLESVLGQAGLPCHVCASAADLFEQLARSAGAILLDGPSAMGIVQQLSDALSYQPSWSDLPIVILADDNDHADALAAFDKLGNVLFLPTTANALAIASAARMALRCRSQQYQLRENMSERQRNERALKEADRRKDEFLAMLAHELRNPLAPIRSALELMQLDPTGEAAEMARDIMQRQVQHLVRLVDGLLDVSRVVRGRIELHTEPLDLRKVINHAVEETRSVVESQGHRLTVHGEEPAWVLGDMARLAQVLVNLVDNAARYTPPGGRITVSMDRGADAVVIAVRDNGVGIARDDLGKIFDLFTQSNRTLERAAGGLGLGLTLARKLAEMHGGTLTAFSEGLGHGSEFVVRLPTIAAPGVPSPLHWIPASVPPRRILVVDDNQGAATILSRMLTRFWQHDVQLAHDGLEALATAARFRPEIIILDIGLPGLSGYEVARQLRSDPQFKRALIVSLTGYGQDDDRRRSEDAGFDEHLVKPTSVVTLEKLFSHPKLPAADQPAAAVSEAPSTQHAPAHL